MSVKKFILVKKMMDNSEDDIYPVKRPTFLTVLCILTFVGSGWALFSAVTAYNTAERTVDMFSDSLLNHKEFNRAQKDSITLPIKADTFSMEKNMQDSLADPLADDSALKKEGEYKDERDSPSAENEMGAFFGEKMKKNVMDMMSVEKMKHSAMGSFIAALFTLAGAIFMWRLKKTGFYIYLIGIAIGIVVPFYIYGNNFLAIGISAFSNFFGLLFVALYALNLKSMK